MRKIIEQCPACGGSMVVTQMKCTECDTGVSGRFKSTIFARLSPESLAFIEVFVRLRGNIKEMERELGVPYSSVRNRLDEVIGELGFEAGGPVPPPAPEPPGSDYQKQQTEILAQLERGEIEPSEAVAALDKLKGKGEAQ